MKLQKNNRLHQNGFANVFVLAAFLLIASSAFVGFAHHSSQAAPASTGLDPFVGTWTAAHDGTDYFILELHKENGTLAGGIRVCAFTMRGEGEHTDITITNKTPSAPLPIRNLVVSGKSLSLIGKTPTETKITLSSNVQPKIPVA